MRKTQIEFSAGQPGGIGSRFAVKAALRAADLFGTLVSLVGFNGSYRLTALLTRFIAEDVYLVIQLDNNEGLFRFCGRDPYWLRLVCRKYHYENEIAEVLSVLRAVDYAFVDCGANLGYWSVRVTSETLGHHAAIAVEPMPKTFAMLEKNRCLNDSRFQTVQLAIYSETGRRIVMSADPSNALSNVGSHIALETPRGDDLGAVETVTLSQLVSDFGLAGRRLVIKLDVEGMEIAAVEGASSAVLAESLLLYEDHGSDRQSSISRYLLQKGFVIFALQRGALKRLHTIDEISSLKTNPMIGYNFFAAHPTSFFKSFLTERSG